MAWPRRRRAAGGTENTVIGGRESWIARLLWGVSFCVREGEIGGDLLEVFESKWGAGIADDQGTAGAGGHGLAGEGGFELEVGEGDVAGVDEASGELGWLAAWWGGLGVEGVEGGVTGSWERARSRSRPLRAVSREWGLSFARRCRSRGGWCRFGTLVGWSRR